MTLTALAVAAAMPAQAQAAEVIVHETDGLADEVAVEQGRTHNFRFMVSATGPISCTSSRESGLSAQVGTDLSVAGNGVVSRTAPSSALAFYSDGNLRFPLGNCGITWDGAPAPYKVAAKVSAAPDTPKGVYRVRVPATVTNPGLGFIGSLEDRSTAELRIRVIGPLEPPLEDNSINVYPSTGQTRVKLPGGTFEPLTQPRHIPDNSIVDTLRGHAFLVSDNDGPTGPGTQEAELWAGYLKVDYTRKLFTPSKPGPDLPITELKLVGSDGKRLECPRRKKARKGNVQTAKRKRRRKRRAWARGKGRYRTKGRYGAGSVRGTAWLTEDSCAGTLVRVTEGTVSVRDFVLKRDFRVKAGSGYFAARAGRAGGRN